MKTNRFLQRVRNKQDILEKKSVGEERSCIIDTDIVKLIVMEMPWYWYRNTKRVEWHRIEN